MSSLQPSLAPVGPKTQKYDIILIFRSFKLLLVYSNITDSFVKQTPWVKQGCHTLFMQAFTPMHFRSTVNVISRLT